MYFGDQQVLPGDSYSCGQNMRCFNVGNLNPPQSSSCKNSLETFSPSPGSHKHGEPGEGEKVSSEFCF